jgi:hypothetical protein
MSWAVGVRLGPLDVVAAALEGCVVGGADVPGAVVPGPDEHAASATSSADPNSSLGRVSISLLLSLGPVIRSTRRRLAGAA